MKFYSTLFICLVLGSSSFAQMSEMPASASQECFRIYAGHASNYLDRATPVAGLLLFSQLLFASEYEGIKDFPADAVPGTKAHRMAMDVQIQYGKSVIVPRVPGKWIRATYEKFYLEFPALTFPQFIREVYDAGLEGVFCAGNTTPFLAPHFISANRWMRPEWSLDHVEAYLHARIPVMLGLREQLKRQEFHR